MGYMHVSVLTIGGHGIFNVSNGLSVWSEGGPGTETGSLHKCCLGKTAPHPVASRCRTLATGFAEQAVRSFVCFKEVEIVYFIKGLLCSSAGVLYDSLLHQGIALVFSGSFVRGTSFLDYWRTTNPTLCGLSVIHTVYNTPTLRRLSVVRTVCNTPTLCRPSVIHTVITLQLAVLA